MPTCWILAGPNGAGKTTFALEYLPQIENDVDFLNVDLIAVGLSPFNPDRKLLSASRLLLNEIEHHIAVRKDFSIETTLAGRTYLKLIDRLRNDYWKVNLIYLALPNVDMSIERVAERVSRGKHNVPIRDIKRRFPRSLSYLLYDYSHRVDQCNCFMNDGQTPEPVFVQSSNGRLIIQNDYYQLLQGGQPMNNEEPPLLSPEVQMQLKTLRLAVRKALERKWRLGQYAVVLENGQVVKKSGDDLIISG